MLYSNIIAIATHSLVQEQCVSLRNLRQKHTVWALFQEAGWLVCLTFTLGKLWFSVLERE